jgi:hypothetical protein
MSGGSFDYLQWRIFQAAKDIELEAEKWSKPRPDEWSEDHMIEPYNQETIDGFLIAAKLCTAAAMAMHDVDWLLSGDTGEDNFADSSEKWRHLIPKDPPLEANSPRG